MTSVTKFRIAALAVIVGGAVYAHRAEAAPLSAFDSCQDYVNGYAAGFCAASGTTPARVVFSCNPDGSATIVKVECNKQVAPPP